MHAELDAASGRSRERKEGPLAKTFPGALQSDGFRRGGKMPGPWGSEGRGGLGEGECRLDQTWDPPPFTCWGVPALFCLPRAMAMPLLLDSSPCGFREGSQSQEPPNNKNGPLIQAGLTIWHLTALAAVTGSRSGRRPKP